MASAQETVLRPIAERMLDETFPGLPDPKRSDYATSMVRQLLTYDGWAMFFTYSFEFWFHMVRQPGNSTDVGRHVNDNCRLEPMRSAGIRDEDMTEIFEQLNVCQSARCYAYFGQPLNLRVDPAKRKLCVELDLESPWRSEGQSS